MASKESNVEQKSLSQTTLDASFTPTESSVDSSSKRSRPAENGNSIESKTASSKKTVDTDPENVSSPSPFKKQKTASDTASNVSKDQDEISFNENEDIDAYCIVQEKWFPARIVHISDEGFTIHYMGWGSREDEFIKRKKLMRLAKRGTEAKDKWEEHDERQAKLKRSREATQDEKLDRKLRMVRGEDVGPSGEVADDDKDLAPQYVPSGHTRSGRKITRRLTNNGAPQIKKKAKTESKPKSTKLPLKQFEEADLCTICGEIEDEQLTDLVFCEGGCLTYSHLGCLGLEGPPEEDNWVCEQCRTNEQFCFACGRNGSINEKAGVFKCAVPGCGKFYHQSCIDEHPLSRRFKGGKPTPLHAPVDKDMSYDAPFRCPRHECLVCEDSKRSKEYMYCLKCPESYHPQCVPPSARYNTIGLLCSKHPNADLPTIPDYLLQVGVDIITVDFNLHFPALFLPSSPPDVKDAEDAHHFRLPSELLDTYKSKPPTYQKLRRNMYTFKPSKVSLEDSPMCICGRSCGDDCINRISYTECFGPALDPSIPISKQTKESNCKLGVDCGNRALHQKLYADTKRVETQGKGWGLVASEYIPANKLVMEYIGEVILEDEKERRLQSHAQNCPDDKNMYIMELEKGVYIDARFKGNESRFINHSCEPNCHLVKWRVKGMNRIAITALRDIEVGEELSYDYQFHTREALEWKCQCGSRKCRGTMAPDKLKTFAETPEKLTRQEKLRRKKRMETVGRTMQVKEEKATVKRLNQTSQIAIGDLKITNKSVVRQGPAKRELAWAKVSRLFLARNAIAGRDFLRRKHLYEKRVRRKANK